MSLEGVVIVSGFLIVLIQIAILIALLFRLSDPPRSEKKVKQDIKKIKDQITG
ncbi:hypothetical protein J4408_03505 [Candidatus Pacearchaeota archaeon]|nr:hypothetical protein [Candidatus Pacearchaeota archaeon]